MIGGSVEDNKAVYGGGICLYKSTMNFSGGTVQNNTAKLCHDTSTDPEQYYSAGGGILANGGSTINLLSNNAQVLNNYADEVGGGISVGSNQWGPTNTLNMDGGLIDGNSAGSSGGGIFIQAKYFSGGPSKAYINAGRITNNAMDGSGVLNKAFGGGGIYVNGANKNYGVNGSNGELHLKNAIIKANTAEWQGAGYASCPILETEIHITDGVAMYQNKPSSLIGRELFIYRDGPGDGYGLHSGEPKITLYKYMLGGVVRWDWRFSENNQLFPEEFYGNEFGLNQHQALQLYTDFEDGNEGSAWINKLALVEISGNTSATRGGGIGSNGTVIFGTEGGTTDISVEKKWENDGDGITRPEDVTVHLIAQLEGDSETFVLKTETLNEGNHWKHTFEDLPKTNAGTKIIYSITEEPIEGYEPTVTMTEDEDGNYHFIVTNAPPEEPHEPQEPHDQTIDIPVEKIWEDKGAEDKRPTSILVRLFADGESTGKTLTLNKSNNWKGVFKDLPEKKFGKIIVYSIKEEKVEGYESEVTGSATSGFTITNKRVLEVLPEPPEEPPTPSKPSIPSTPSKPSPPSTSLIPKIPQAGA